MALPGRVRGFLSDTAGSRAPGSTADAGAAGPATGRGPHRAGRPGGSRSRRLDSRRRWAARRWPGPRPLDRAHRGRRQTPAAAISWAAAWTRWARPATPPPRSRPRTTDAAPAARGQGSVASAPPEPAGNPWETPASLRPAARVAGPTVLRRSARGPVPRAGRQRSWGCVARPSGAARPVLPPRLQALPGPARTRWLRPGYLRPECLRPECLHREGARHARAPRKRVLPAPAPGGPARPGRVLRDLVPAGPAARPARPHRPALPGPPGQRGRMGQPG
jgi:hypothetical protein